jgi:hypothetical protein
MIPLNRQHFQPLNKLAAAVADNETKNKGKRKKDKHARDEIDAWLLKQNAYTMHRPVRKRFPRNPYSVNNIMDVWEAILWMYSPLRNTTTVIDIY